MCTGLLLRLIKVIDTHTRSRTHTHTHIRVHEHAWLDYSERGIGPSQRLLPDSTQHSQQTHQCPSGIRTRNSRKRARTDRRLRTCKKVKVKQSRYRPKTLIIIISNFWSGPEDSRKLRFPDFMTTAQNGGKVVSLTRRPPLPLGNTPVTHFC
jgi:hypothetical protein